MRDTEGARRAARPFGLPLRVAAGFAAALLALVAAGVALGSALAARSDRGARMMRSRNALEALHELEAALVVSTTTLDVYVATGDAGARLRHVRAAAAVSDALERLDAAMGPQPAPPHAVERLARLVRTIEAQEARLAALRDRGDAAAADGARRTSAIPAALREVHDTVEALSVAEDAVSRAREAAWRRMVTVTQVVAAGSALALFVLLVAAARAVRLDVARRDRGEAEHERILELQQRLMAIVGHDLRTPLSAISWTAALLGRSALGDADARLVRRIAASARRMERLIRDVLDYSRVHVGAGIPIEPHPADLRVICREVVDEIHDPAHPVAFAAEGDTAGVWDADRLEQIVANLVSNAVKYGPVGQPVRVRAFGEGDAVRIEVHDDGGTIPADVRARLFEPFGRGEGVSGKGSVGLGLFIVRTLTEAHGGTVAVDSTPYRGTTFTVRLPRTAPARGTVRIAATG